jgi:hypothetical protein
MEVDMFNFVKGRVEVVGGSSDHRLVKVNEYTHVVFTQYADYIGKFNRTDVIMVTGTSTEGRALVVSLQYRPLAREGYEPCVVTGVTIMDQPIYVWMAEDGCTAYSDDGDGSREYFLFGRNESNAWFTKLTDGQLAYFDLISPDDENSSGCYMDIHLKDWRVSLDK